MTTFHLTKKHRELLRLIEQCPGITIGQLKDAIVASREPWDEINDLLEEGLIVEADGGFKRADPEDVYTSASTPVEVEQPTTAEVEAVPIKDTGDLLAQIAMLRAENARLNEELWHLRSSGGIESAVKSELNRIDRELATCNDELARLNKLQSQLQKQHKALSQALSAIGALTL